MPDCGSLPKPAPEIAGSILRRVTSPCAAGEEPPLRSSLYIHRDDSVVPYAWRAESGDRRFA